MLFAPMAPSSLADHVGWIVAFFGIVASLVWNWHNARATEALRQKLAGDAIALEEFRRVRNRIDNAINELQDRWLNLNSLVTSGHEIEELRSMVGTEHQSITAMYGRLQLALELASKSQFAAGEEWSELGAEDWENYVNCIDGVQNTHRTSDESRDKLKFATLHLAQVFNSVNECLDGKLRAFLPAN